MPPIFWMSSVASSCTTSTMSSTVTMPFMRPLGVDDRHAPGSRARRRAGSRASWSMSSRHGDDVGAHDVAHALARAARRTARGTRPRRAGAARRRARRRSRCVSTLLARLAAQVADRLVDAHVRAQPRVARVHQAAGVVLGVGEQRRRPPCASARRAARAGPRGPRPAPPGRRRRRRRAAGSRIQRAPGARSAPARSRSAWSRACRPRKKRLGLGVRQQAQGPRAAPRWRATGHASRSSAPRETRLACSLLGAEPA